MFRPTLFPDHSHSLIQYQKQAEMNTHYSFSATNIARNLLAVLSYPSAVSTLSIPVFSNCPYLFLIHMSVSMYMSTPSCSRLRTTSLFFRLRNFFALSAPSPLYMNLLTAYSLTQGHPAFGSLLIFSYGNVTNSTTEFFLDLAITDLKSFQK